MPTEGIQVNMTPPHPGEFIRVEVIEEIGLSVREAAEILRVSEVALSDVLSCNAELSPEMARRIERTFSVGMDMLLRMQAWHNRKS